MMEARDLQKERDEKAILFLKRLVEKYDRQIETLKELRRAAEILLAAEESSSVPLLKSGATQVDDKLYAGMSAAEAAADYLKNNENTPIKSDELTEILLAGGWRSNAIDKRSTVSSALSRDPRFEKAPSGGYRLKQISTERSAEILDDAPKNRNEDSRNDLAGLWKNHEESARE